MMEQRQIYQDKADVVIFTAGFGQGHLAAAEALRESLAKVDSHLRVDQIDLLVLLLPHLSRPLYDSYKVLVNSAPGLYNYFWEQKEADQDVMTTKGMTAMLLPAVAEYMKTVQPALVISTFPLCSYYLSQYKNKYNADFKLITCVTDVVCRREWLHSGTDLYFVPTLEIKDRMMTTGIPGPNIAVSGIPVRKSFKQNTEPKDGDLGLGIAKEDFVIMLMGGGTGKIPVDIELYSWLSQLPGVKSLLITANNTKLYDRLHQAHLNDNIKILGFEKQIAPMMRRANLLVTRAGGVSLFEAIACQLPMLVYRPSLGQEIENAVFVQKRQIGRMCNNTEELKDAISALVKNPMALEMMKAELRKLDREYDGNAISRCVEEMLYWPLHNDERIENTI